jgi:drug/metabolite transporter (DMT)-like permease
MLHGYNRRVARRPGEMQTNTEYGTVSKFTNRLFIVLVVATNTLGNILLGIGMERMPDFYAVPFLSYITTLGTSWQVLGGTALLVVWMIAQLSMFTWADLTYVLPVTSSAYILTAILSKFFLGEQISVARWIGIVIISFGVLLVSETPPDTKHGDVST